MSGGSFVEAFNAAQIHGPAQYPDPPAGILGRCRCGTVLATREDRENRATILTCPEAASQEHHTGDVGRVYWDSSPRMSMCRQ